MDWIILIIVGALIGWIASKVMATDEQQGAVANVIVGIVGALLGRWIFADLLGIGGAAAAGTLSFAGVIWGIIGAIILIAILKALKVLK
jgi:uncharacterized membrane protein YeaQ/YmgE (transglycosylase-associated protein family)